MTNWDNEIDDVARAMTEGEPHGSLKARVLARTHPQRRSIWRSPWILAPIATVAIVIVAVVVMRRPNEIRVQPDATTAKSDPTPVRLKPDTTGASVAASLVVAPGVVASAARRLSV